MNVRVIDFNMAFFPALQDLFGSHFSKDDRLLTPEYTEWLYCKNPFGQAKAVVVSDGSNWIGFMALVPTTLIGGGNTLSTYYVVNVLVHPQWRGKNIFGEMITAATSTVWPSGAALMGYPNAMAHKSWIRGGMHFHSPLTLRLVAPSWRRWQEPIRSVTVETIPEGLLADYRAQSTNGRHWRVDVSATYIKWRFLDHPFYRYDVRVFGDVTNPVSMIITRKLKPFAHLLIDHFTLESATDSMWATMPWLTVCFVPETWAAAMGNRLLTTPIKKHKPFFLTAEYEGFAQVSTAEIGLSASDF